MAEVLLTDGAARDLDEWYAAAYARGGHLDASRSLERIGSVFAGISAGRLRDEPLPELRHLGRHIERQVVTDDGFKIVFRRESDRLLVVLIAPVNRSYQVLLERRLLDA